jgi:manganese/iron transport system substrate-binding protein
MFPKTQKMMTFKTKGTSTAAALALTVSLVSACTQPPPTTEAKGLKVVATTTILCDLTKQIAGDTVDLTCLLKPGVDGHTYEPVPEDRKAIETAQLILYSGYDFEPSIIKLVSSTSNQAPKIAVAERAIPKPLMGEEHHHEHETHEPEEKEASEAVPDPHVWQAAQNGVQMVKIIGQELGKLAPEQARVYAQNAQILEAELGEIDSWIKSQIATIPPTARKLVTTHETMGYYGAAYGIAVKGALQGVSTEEKPTAARVKELVDSLEGFGVPTIFAEVVVNPKLLEKVAKEAKVKISQRPLYSDSLGEPGSEGDRYQKMLIANTRTIVEGLGGKYTPFQPQRKKG